MPAKAGAGMAPNEATQSFKHVKRSEENYVSRLAGGSDGGDGGGVAGETWFALVLTSPSKIASQSWDGNPRLGKENEANQE